jgi:trimeric autotransporter adhesin
MRCVGRSRRLLLGLVAGGAALAQQYTISTVAGGAPPATPAAGTSISLGQPQRVTADSAGNVYFTSLNCVFRLDPTGNVTLVAGNSRAGFSGDGGPAVQAQLNAPMGLAVDSSGDLLIADSANNRVREVTPNGIIQTVAGNGSPGVPGSTGDYGPAIQANLHTPAGVAVDSSGDLYIADSGHSSVRLVTPDGNISTFAGDGYAGYYGDGGAPSTAAFDNPQDVAVGGNGTIYVADTGNALIRAISQGIVSTVAGNDGATSTSTNQAPNTLPGSSGVTGFSGDGGIATTATFYEPSAVAVDSSGNLYIADMGNDAIRKVTISSTTQFCPIPGGTNVACFTGNIKTVAGTGTVAGFSGDGSSATKATLNLPSGVAVDNQGNIYIADSWNLRIRKVNGSGTISTGAGDGLVSYSGDGGPAMAAQLNGPKGVGVDAKGNQYVADSRNGVVRMVSSKGMISSIGGGSFVSPQGVSMDSAGNAYIADLQGNKVWRIGTGGTLTVFAGTGTQGESGDGGPASNAELDGPAAVAVDPAGNVYIAEFSGNRIREVGTSGTITTVAGNGIQGYSGDGGPALAASLNGPIAIAVDTAGDLYIADSNNSVIREVGSNRVIHTIAGTGVSGYTGDGGPAVQAQLISPSGIAVDTAGNVYFSDGPAYIREIFPSGAITTIAGNGAQGYSGDGGLATHAMLDGPTGLWTDASGNVYVADAGNNAVRLLQPAGSGLTLTSVTNGASNQAGAVAPGEILVLYGSGLGPSQLTTYQPGPNGTVPASLAGTSVSFNGIAAPVLYASATQVGVVAPFEITGSNVQVSVQYQGQSSAALALSVAPAAPGIFTLNASGQGQAIAFNANGQLNSSANTAASGSQLTLYATGGGQTSPPSTDGSFGSAPLPQTALPVSVTIGGQPATVTTAGGALNQVAGMVAITVEVPSNVQPGSAVPVTLQIGSATAQTGVTVAIGN